MLSLKGVYYMQTQVYTQVNGARLYYETVGEGFPLVLVHAFSFDSRMWDGQVAAFARHYHVIRYDVRGYGKSDVPTSEGYYHADDLKGLLDHLGIRRAHVLGLSLGAAIAIEFALAYPEKTGALVAADPVLWGYAWSSEYGASLAQLSSVGRESGAEAANALWLAHPMFAPLREKPELEAWLRRSVAEYSGWHWTHNDPGLLPDPPAAYRLEQIAAPTLAILGELDAPDFHAITDIISQRVPNARKVVLPGVGHMSNVEDPKSFNETVLRFLADVDSTMSGHPM